MTAPSIKEALERVIEAAERALGYHAAPHDCYATGPSTGNWIADLVACPGCVLKSEIEDAKSALATLQPDGERRDAIARILADPKHQERARYVQGFLYGDDHVIRDVALRENQELFRTKDEHEYEQRLEIEKAKFAAGAILASGLVQNEAGILKAMEQECWTLRCVDIPTGGGDADVGWEVIQHHQAKPYERMIAHGRTPQEALTAAIRSARDGGAS